MRNKSLLTFLVILTIVCLLSPPRIFSAENSIPQMIHYQVRLTDSNNNPRSGAIAFTFRIYDSLTGGNYIWPSDGSTESQTLTVENGHFSASVGSVKNIPLSAFNSDTAYLE
ncbi:MAG: hypothetical protein HY610_04015, partial [Elusimicrobia bacterium]|nr:hypothetical protein [Elusimicrobiota bacterium]